MASSFMTGELAETECTQLGGHGYHTVETRKWPAAAAQRLLVGAEDWAQRSFITMETVLAHKMTSLGYVNVSVGY